MSKPRGCGWAQSTDGGPGQGPEDLGAASLAQAPSRGRHPGHASTPRGRHANTSRQPSGARAQPKLGSGGRRLPVGGGLFRKTAPQEGQPQPGEVQPWPGNTRVARSRASAVARTLGEPLRHSVRRRSLLTGAAPCPPGASTQCAGRVAATYHIHRAEDVAVMVAGLQVLGDVGKGAQVLWVLSRAGNVPDLVLGDDVLRRKRLCSAPSPALLFGPSPGRRPNATSSSALWGRRGRGWRLISSDLGLGSPPLSTAAEGVNVHIQPPLALQGLSAGPGGVLRSLRPVSSEVAHAEEDKLSPGTQVRGCMRD